jgi:tRNA threonylcarbamoyladenosine biosynthesis protein TsaB
MLTLAVEASTYTGSVAVIRDGVVVAEWETAMRGEHEERLMPAVAEALRAAAVSPNDITRIVCGEGPGSFTSLRIAAAIAKGLALTTRAPLYAVSSLFLLVAGARASLVPGRYVAVLDAMRGDVFAAVFSVAGDVITPESAASIVARADIVAFAHEHSGRLIGPEESLTFFPHARGAALMDASSSIARAVDLATWEPNYGRLAEAQVRWEATHGRALTAR